MKIKKGVLASIDEYDDIKNGVFNVPDNVTRINGYVFCDCTGLKSVTIPNSVTSIGSFAFYGCSRLMSVTICNSVTRIGNHAFYCCKKLNSKHGYYKGFELCNGNLHATQNYTRYEIGKEAIANKQKLKPCAYGIHFCTNIFDIFNYYYGVYDKDFVVCECRVDGEIVKGNGDSKCCTDRLTPIKRLTRQEVIDIMNGDVR